MHRQVKQIIHLWFFYQNYRFGESRNLPGLSHLKRVSRTIPPLIPIGMIRHNMRIARLFKLFPIFLTSQIPGLYLFPVPPVTSCSPVSSRRPGRSRWLLKKSLMILTKLPIFTSGVGSGP